MASVSFHIAHLLDKMTSSDKDFRFMATNDLMSELQKDSIKLDDDSERKVVKMLLKLLEDKNGEVQNLAVKCLGPLVTKVKEFQVETIVDILCSNMMSDKEQLRDISSIGLKTVIAELPAAQPAPNMPPIVASVCKKITGKLTAAIANKDDVSVQLEALDILADLLSRFGSMLLPFHTNIQEALLPQLASPRLAVRKRAIIAIGYLVLSCPNSLYNNLLDYLLTELTKNSSISTTRTYIQCIGAVSRQSGPRFGEHLDQVMPLVMEYCTKRSEEFDDELREHCLQAFESFVRRCPKEIAPSIPMIMGLCCEFISHDPNYNYEDDDIDGMELEEEENDTDDEYSDDDDMSWKVRRASAKCLEAIIATRPEMLPTFYKTISPVLIDRFKEREENVQADILHCYVTLLKMTRPSIGPTRSDPDSMDHTEAPVLMLQQQVPQIIRAVARHMKDKSMKRRQGCFQLLTELVMVLPEALAEHINLIIPALHFSLSEKCQSSNMKMETLSLIHVLLMTHSPSVFHPHIPTLLPPIITAVDDSFYKITSEALLVTQQLVKVIRPLDTPSNFDFTPYTDSLYQCTLVRLKAADIDQEVKERAISCMGTIITHLGDHLQAQLETCLPIFLDRLRNEITRLTAVKALTGISASPLKVDLRLILGEAFPILASFLRKNQRALKLCTLSLLNKLVLNYNSVTVAMLNKVLIEVPPLLTESELHIAQLTLILLTSIAQLHPQALYNINDAILPEIFKLLESPLLQGAALNSLLKLFQALVYAEIPGVGYADLLEVLMSPVHKQVSRGDVVQLHKQMKFSDYDQGPLRYSKQTYHSVAKCVAALTVTQKSTGATGNVVGQLVNDIQRGSSRGGDALWMFSLLALGEIGRHIDLSNVNGLQECILNSFSASSEEVKSAAAFALGGVSTGNLSYFLPTLLTEIQCQPRRLYLLLHSLKEIISHQSRHVEGEVALNPWIAPVWKELFNHCECPEEGTRNVVAECLGKLTLLDPSNLLPRLREQLQHPSGLMRATVVTAIKFTISDTPSPIDSLLRSCIGEFLQTLVDPELNVRRVALVAFNSAAHNKPSLIRDLLVTVLPHLYNETKVRKDLIREVEMGPFKHTVDDGLDVRKAAWECMYTLLDAGACRDRLDVFEFLGHVEDGLRDHYDIQMLTYLMLVRLAQLCPNAVLHRMETLIEPLRSTCASKVKANSVKQEYEKQDELKRSAMRAFNALAKVPDADKNPAITDFLNHIKGNGELQALYDSVQKDSVNNSGHVGTPPDAMAMDIS